VNGHSNSRPPSGGSLKARSASVLSTARHEAVGVTLGSCLCYRSSIFFNLNNGIDNLIIATLSALPVAWVPKQDSVFG